jgi:hypothetical protein
VFDPTKFNFSLKWLLGFKKSRGIQRIRLHGEGASADNDRVAIVRTQLPPLLADTPLDKIYNFDESGKAID